MRLTAKPLPFCIEAPFRGRLFGMETTTTQLNPERLALAAKDAARLVGISRAQWWKLFSAGKTPMPVYLGTKAPRWRVEELRAWLAANCPDLQTWQRLRGGKQ